MYKYKGKRKISNSQSVLKIDEKFLNQLYEISSDVGSTRDRLQNLITESEDLLYSIDQAHELLVQAADCLSEYA